MSHLVESERPYEATRSARAAASQRGFTLLELLVALSIVSILFTVAVPSFFNITRNSRAAANANELVTALSVARSEAVRRGARVSVCPSVNGAVCSGSNNWAQGWIVVADVATATDTSDPDVAAEVLRVWPAPSGNTAITTPANMRWVRFLPRGTVRVPPTVALPVTYQMRVEGCTGTQARSIALNTVGRTTVNAIACI